MAKQRNQQRPKEAKQEASAPERQLHGLKTNPQPPRRWLLIVGGVLLVGWLSFLVYVAATR